MIRKIEKAKGRKWGAGVFITLPKLIRKELPHFFTADIIIENLEERKSERDGNKG